MSCICATVEIICWRNDSSVIVRLFLEIVIKRLLIAQPRPCNRCCVSVSWKLDASSGTNEAKMLSVVIRELLNVSPRFVPVANPCE